MRWYEESWGALMRAGLTSTSKYEKSEHGQVIIRLRVICLLGMYLGMNQRLGELCDGFETGLCALLEELNINKKATLEILNINKKTFLEAEGVSVPRLADMRYIVGENYLDYLNDLEDDLDNPDSDSLNWEELEELLDWKMIEEAVLDLIREENSSIYNVLENHYGGKDLLFVSIWNSRSPLYQAEPPDFVLNLDITRDKLSIHSYVVNGMCDWKVLDDNNNLE